MRTSELSFRVDPELKDQATHLFRQLGISTSAALRLLLENAVARQALHVDLPGSSKVGQVPVDAAPGLRLWENDARRMHRNRDDRMVIRQKPGIAGGTKWNW